MNKHLFYGSAIFIALTLLGAGCTPSGSKTRSTSASAPAPLPTAVKKIMTRVALIVTEGTAVPPGTKVVRTKVGCNDKVVLADVPVRALLGNNLGNALTTLFSGPTLPDKNLYNSLTQSSLNVLDIKPGAKGVTEVYLTGTVITGGVCDDPRVKAQIESTISQYTKKFTIYLNGSLSAYKCLGDESGTCK